MERDRLMRQARVELQAIGERLNRLTPREREVFQHVVAGQPNKQIAATSAPSRRQSRSIASRVMEKMGRAFARRPGAAWPKRIGPTAITASPGSRTPDTPLR